MKRIAIFLFAALIVAGCSARLADPQIEVEFEYRIEGDAEDLTIVYKDEDGKDKTVNEDAPWSEAFTKLVDSEDEIYELTVDSVGLSVSKPAHLPTRSDTTTAAGSDTLVHGGANFDNGDLKMDTETYRVENESTGDWATVLSIEDTDTLNLNVDAFPAALHDYSIYPQREFTATIYRDGEVFWQDHLSGPATLYSEY